MGLSLIQFHRLMGPCISTVLDLEEVGRRSLHRKIAEEIQFRPDVDRDETPNNGQPNFKANYGFAWSINETNGHKLIEHSGAWQGFTTHIAEDTSTTN